jgi:hypothetical protein
MGVAIGGRVWAGGIWLNSRHLAIRHSLTGLAPVIQSLSTWLSTGIVDNQVGEGNARGNIPSRGGRAGAMSARTPMAG